MLSRAVTQTVKRSIRSALKTQFPTQSLLVNQTRIQLTKPAFFSTSISRLNETPKLTNVLAEELEFENNDTFELDPNYVTYLEENGFKIAENQNNVLCKFIKTKNNLKMHVFFDVQRITQAAYELKQLEQELISKPEEEDEEFNAERELINDELNQASFTDINLVLENTETGKAIGFDLVMSILSNEFSIAGITNFNNASQALDESAEANQSRDVKYSGPPFGNLAEDLQASLSNYLFDLGINNDLAEIILAYSSVKENKEYIKWLGDTKSFFERV